MRALGLAALIALAVAGSAGARQKQAPDTGSAGATPSDYDIKIKAFLNDTLKDPESAKIEELRGPRVGAHLVDRGFLGHLWGEPAWWVCYKVNAKNSYGGYVGYHKYMFAFINGRIAGYRESPSSGYGGRDWPDEEVEDECERGTDSSFGTPGGPPVG
jgi:hypothetical protein